MRDTIYGLHLSHVLMVLTVRWNMLPLFYEDGMLHTRMKITNWSSDSLVLEWARDDEPANAYLRPTRTDRIRKTMRLDIRLSGISGLKIDDAISMKPKKNGIILYFGREPDPGIEPKITPLFIKRIKFYKSKKITKGVGGKVSARIYLMNEQIKKYIKGRFTALSHLGGTLFLFNDDPMSLRAPFLEIINIESENYQALYAKLPIGLANLIGLGNREFKCIDYIIDIDERHYLRLVDKEECGG